MNSYYDTEPVPIPRIVIAGIQSNSGKTTIARGLMAALAGRGMVVQPFKIGPDFIDPSYHTQICGRVSRNLDPVMMGTAEVKQTFIRASKGADIAVIEGVMGMFDGVDGTTEGSTAEVSKIIDAPVILVIPVGGMSGSVHAIAEGFKNYDPTIHLVGVILNKVGSARHIEMLRVGRTIEQLGFIPKLDDLQVSSRHLGLLMAEEIDVPHDLARIMEEHCDIPGLIRIAWQAPPIQGGDSSHTHHPQQVRIAVAHDPAFCFYYQDNLDRLRNSGAELIFFSPMTDLLPPADLLYLGGGYPELHAQSLESGPAREDIRKAGEDGMPIYGECGGLMYLGKGMSECDSENAWVRWVDLLPAEAFMEKRFQALNYTMGISAGGPSVAPAGTNIRGHEFHYSRMEPDRDAQYAVSLSRGIGISGGRDGMYVNNCMGSYTHAYFSSRFADQLIAAALSYQKR
ncbi:MAG TPA: cobyrinate a,c-diamide synthase [Methanospirillum sp.]|nr:cobyrinate a,c-diamide synthase [Methanospirillum sp.]